MLRLLTSLIRVLVFSLVVIVLSNAVHWRGRTISDEVRVQLAHAERSPWAEDLGSRAHAQWNSWVDWAFGLWKSAPRPKLHTESDEPRASALSRAQERLAADTTDESLPASERQKLKALIRELNGSHGRD